MCSTYKLPKILKVRTVIVTKKYKAFFKKIIFILNLQIDNEISRVDFKHKAFETMLDIFVILQFVWTFPF